MKPLDPRLSASDAVVRPCCGGAEVVPTPGLAALLIACGDRYGDAVGGFALCCLLFGDSLGGPIGARSVHRVGGLTRPCWAVVGAPRVAADRVALWGREFTFEMADPFAGLG